MLYVQCIILVVKVNIIILRVKQQIAVKLIYKHFHDEALFHVKRITNYSTCVHMETKTNVS